MSGPSTYSGSGDDVCLARFGESSICRRPDGHPTIAEDGIGHNTSPIALVARVEDVKQQVQELLYPPLVPGRFNGVSLSFVRQLLAIPARYPSAAMAMSAQKLRSDPVQPPFRAVAWYSNAAHGNVAVSVGEGWVLSYDRVPCVRRFDAPVLGMYEGWSETIR